MPKIITNIGFLADIPLYQHEKPYVVFLPIDNKLVKENVKTDNLQFDIRRGITVEDIRELPTAPCLETTGFQILNHSSPNLVFSSADDLKVYKLETASLLKKELGAVEVICYDAKASTLLRKNIKEKKTVRDLNQPLEADKPSFSAHVDNTFASASDLIRDLLTNEKMEKYLQPGYSFRIINTWRSLLPVIENNPLAVCDYRSVDKADLVASDRIMPARAGEVYFLKYNPSQKWYWLDSMTSEELLLMLMYDSGSNNRAKYCPHAAVTNPGARKDAPRRFSIETRSIVITKDAIPGNV